MPKPDDDGPLPNFTEAPANDLLPVSNYLQRYLLHYRFELPTEVREGLAAAIDQLDQQRQNIDDSRQIDQTVEGECFDLEFVARSCATIWMQTQVLQPDGGVWTYRRESQIGKLSQFLDSHNGNPSFADASVHLAAAISRRPKVTVLANGFETENFPPVRPEEFWGNCWSGPELAAIDADDKSRAEFWRIYLEECWRLWRELYAASSKAAWHGQL
jgi:hypothetical protein